MRAESWQRYLGNSSGRGPNKVSGTGCFTSHLQIVDTNGAMASLNAWRARPDVGSVKDQSKQQEPLDTTNITCRGMRTLDDESAKIYTSSAGELV